MKPPDFLRCSVLLVVRKMIDDLAAGFELNPVGQIRPDFPARRLGVGLRRGNLGRHFRATPRLQFASIAVMLAGAGKHTGYRRLER